MNIFKNKLVLFALMFCTVNVFGQQDNEVTCEDIIDNCLVEYIQENEACRQWEGEGSMNGEIYRNGKVVIGGGPSHSDHKLTVAGEVLTEEFKVDVNAWPDYVFTEEYKMMSLEELEAFIHKNGHLPNIPTEEKIMKEGISLGDMTVLQQEKIEELYLHLIQMQKETALLESILAELDKK